MCGRYQLKAPAKSLAEVFGAVVSPEAADLPPRYNVAPTTAVPIVVRYPEAPDRRVLTAARWGLVPFWAKDTKIGNKMINARAEGVADKPAFRAAVRYRRCLIPCDGFYEWKAGTKPKQPYLVRTADDQPFALAGLWELWKDEFQSCAILTTGANDLMRPIHDRMPVILGRDDYEAWLNPKAADPQAVAPLLRPYPAEAMTATPVSTFVNSPRNEGPQCAEPWQ